MATRFIACLALALSLHSTVFGCGYGLYRAMGPEGLETVLQQFDEAKARYETAVSANEPLARMYKTEMDRLAAAVDDVAAQRYGTISRLYWYTDLDQAKAAATESGKPILSLRMLGKLTDEYSCANSRFFRTTLYANKEISDYLRDNFVLHWQSVRPVPRVTIDFGDGRKIDQTITGNSAHYLLSAAGEPLDVLPGLYSPREFQNWLGRGVALAKAYSAAADEAARTNALMDYHVARQAELAKAVSDDLKKIDMAHVVDNASNLDFLDGLTQESIWLRIANLHREEVALDASSRTLIVAENPNAFQASAVAVAKSASESPLLTMIVRFENGITLDTVKNEYRLHRRIHEWFTSGQVTADLNALNGRVYAELFLTPLHDPWMGLMPGVYTALNGGGLTFPSP